MASTHTKAFVFTGMSFLLVIPAIMLAASFAGMIRYGEAGREIALKSDVVYYTSKDIRETIETVARKSGRWEAYQATKLVIDTYANLTRTKNISYAKAHSFFPDTEVDPQGRNATTYLKDKIIVTMNLRLNETIEELGKRSGTEIILNDGNEITDEQLTISQSDPWGFYISITEMPLFVSGNGSVYNTTVPATSVYITFEGLEDPYIFVESGANTFSRIYRSPYEPYNISYAENWTVNRINNLYNALIGSGTEDNPMPYYHYFDDPTKDDGISFFSRLEGNSTNRPYKIETFLIGDVLMNQSIDSRVDHAYFGDVDGSNITICVVEFKDSLGNVFYIDDDHLSYYGLVRDYPCDYVDLRVEPADITYNSSVQIEGDSITIEATVHNDGNIDTSTVNTVKVQFFNGTPGADGTVQIDGDLEISTIDPGGSATTNVVWTATVETTNIYVVVDPYDDFFEPIEVNNQAFKPICVTPATSSLSLSILPPLQDSYTTDNCTGTYVDINATVRDSCSNFLEGNNATVISNISTDGPIILTDLDEDAEYYGNWTPLINGTAEVNITAVGNASYPWQGFYGEKNITVYVSNCTG